MTVEQLSREAERLGSHSNELCEFLWDSVRDLLTGGVPQDDIVDVLNDLYVRFGNEGLEDAADEVAEVLNSLTGYCLPSARLDPSAS